MGICSLCVCVCGDGLSVCILKCSDFDPLATILSQSFVKSFKNTKSLNKKILVVKFTSESQNGRKHCKHLTKQNRNWYL